MVRKQSQKRLMQLIGQYPAIGPLRVVWHRDWGAVPETRIVVQRPDPEFMHQSARNALNVDRSYVMDQRYPGERGSAVEVLYAANGHHQIIGELDWRKIEGEARFTTTVQDIFSRCNPSEAAYLFWLLVNDWYEEHQKEITRPRELTFIVYPRPKNMMWEELVAIANQQKQEREEAYKYLPKLMPNFPGIQTALKNGARMHAFSSGGGLRVVSLEKGRRTLGYGEAPHVEDALVYTDEDFIAGGLPYKEVYGSGKKHPHYLTGSSLPSSNIDAWVRWGSTFDCWQEDDLIVFQLSGYANDEMPDWVKKVTENNPGEPHVWETRSITYEVVFHLDYFANGDPGWTTTIIANPESKRSAYYSITKTGRGSTFWEAVITAFAAPEEEVLLKKPVSKN